MSDIGGLSEQKTGEILDCRNHLAPLFVIAPSTRCGTTFIQRLLNSSKEILIYGENPFLIEGLPSLFAGVMLNFTGARAEELEATRRGVLADGLDGWYPNLSPDPAKFFLVVMRQFVESYLCYQEDARTFGFENWGVKYPLKDAASMSVIAHTLPHARFIVLYRHVADALASARARRFVTDRESAEEFVKTWNDNTVWLNEWTGPRILHVRYEDLVADPASQLPDIFGMAGVSRVDQATFETKVNTFATPGEGRAPSGYILPETLPEEDYAIIRALAGPGLTARGYDAG